MTHLYAYLREGYTKEQIKDLIAKVKASISEGLNIDDEASTVIVKELEEGSYSENFGVFMLLYTAKGKGIDIKKRFVKLFNDSCSEVLENPGEIKIVIKEQANDMVGLNGSLRCNEREINTSYEIG